MSDALPSEAQVRAAMTWLLRQSAADGTRATATALAARVGISRPALYRHYRHLVDELLNAAAESEPTHRHYACNHQQELGKLRQRSEDLRRHVKVYEEVIRQLTIENLRLRQQLDNHANVSNLAARRRDHDPSLPVWVRHKIGKGEDDPHDGEQP